MYNLQSTIWKIFFVSCFMNNFNQIVNLNRQKELEMLMVMKENKGSVENVDNGYSDHSVSTFSKYFEDRRINVESQEALSVEAANSLMAKLRAQLEPFRFVADETTPWEEKSATIRLVNKTRKSKRNKLWRKRKRKHIAEMLAKVAFLMFFLASLPSIVDVWWEMLILCFNFVILIFRSMNDLNKLIKKLMSGELGRLLRILLSARCLDFFIFLICILWLYLVFVSSTRILRFYGDRLVP